MIDDLTLIKLLGKGSFGEVYLSSKQGSQEYYATKKIDKKYAEDPKIKKYFQNEISILKELNHKNIMRLYDVKITQNHYYLVCELCNGGSLTECLDKYQKINRKPFTEEIVQYLMIQIIDAMKYIHSKKIIHRDLKLDNILVNFTNDEDKKNLNMLKCQVKIIDFGFATRLIAGNLAQSTLGSPINMDPIILEKLNSRGNKKEYDEKADIWSLGTVCYEMLIGRSTFDAYDMSDLVKKVEKGDYTLPTNLSKEVVSFLNGMLQYDPKWRLSAEELSRHIFLKKNVKDFTHIDLSKLQKNLNDDKELKINVKNNQSIWAIFNADDQKTLTDVPGYILEEKNEDNVLDIIPEDGKYINKTDRQNYNNNNYGVTRNPANNPNYYNNTCRPGYNNNQITPNQYAFGRNPNTNYNMNNRMNQVPMNNNMYNRANTVNNNMNNNVNNMYNKANTMNNNANTPTANTQAPVVKNEYIDEKFNESLKKLFDYMNDDFVYNEPMFIPIIPGHDPAVINADNKYNEDEDF